MTAPSRLQGLAIWYCKSKLALYEETILCLQDRLIIWCDMTCIHLISWANTSIRQDVQDADVGYMMVPWRLCGLAICYRKSKLVLYEETFLYLQNIPALSFSMISEQKIMKNGPREDEICKKLHMTLQYQFLHRSYQSQINHVTEFWSQLYVVHTKSKINFFSIFFFSRALGEWF